MNGQKYEAVLFLTEEGKAFRGEAGTAPEAVAGALAKIGTLNDPWWRDCFKVCQVSDEALAGIFECPDHPAEPCLLVVFDNGDPGLRSAQGFVRILP